MIFKVTEISNHRAWPGEDGDVAVVLKSQYATIKMDRVPAGLIKDRFAFGSCHEVKITPVDDAA